MSNALAARIAAAGLDWIVPDWPAPASVRAFSTTRHGRAGTAFDLSPRVPDRELVRAELRRWLPEDPTWLAQVHGSTVCEIDGVERANADAPRADAAVARSARRVCAVQTADCMPVLFADRAGEVVAAAHAGWRGLAAGVLETTLAAMRVEPKAVIAWLGPAIGPRAFEVGPDVLAALCAEDAGAAACFAPLRPGKWLADLYGLARRRLARAGVETVRGGDRCTFTERDLFYSYRRDRGDSRMATFIWRE
ncbi:MAG TPA: peptidoglycan editing factor PgeF [Casimicrobiaceae bacterium]|nr:peptidoglycan editing factor PgeF [Casimicrobiaceae bacterium]